MNQNISSNNPKTCIIFVTFGRPEIAAKSYESLENAISKYRDEIKIIISDATNSDEKYNWLKNTQADDIIHTPRFTPAATSRNLATTLMMDKYVPQNVCMIEDDFSYDEDWYPTLVRKTEECYGVISPLDLAYGMFSASQHHIPDERKKFDKENKLIAYYFGAVAYQRFMPLSHYLSVLRNWDADVLGISYAQTGLQTFRNTMRGFCGGITPEPLSWPIDQDSTGSTWSKGKRDPGPPAHSFDLEKYKIIQEQVKKIGGYSKNKVKKNEK
jgi:hypothetical protein